MKKNNHFGFGHIEFLLIILILSVISFGGYYVWHNNNKTKTQSDTSVTNYYQCWDKKGKTDSDKTTDCTWDGKTYKLPTTFTMDMIKGYDKLPQNFKDKAVEIAKSIFYCGTSTERWPSELSVEFVSKNSDAILLGVGCDSGYRALYEDVNNIWTETVHTQNKMDCDLVNRYQIPASVVSECYDSATNNTTTNTNSM